MSVAISRDSSLERAQRKGVGGPKNAMSSSKLARLLTSGLVLSGLITKLHTRPGSLVEGRHKRNYLRAAGKLLELLKGEVSHELDRCLGHLIDKLLDAFFGACPLCGCS